MGYIYLICTIVTETLAVICMKFSNGFQQLYYAAVAIAAYALSFIFLTMALKQLPSSIANATWAGASTILVAVAGYYFFNERLSWLQLVSMLFIVAGLIGLNYQKT